MTNRKPKVLIIGSNGFVGGHLSQEFLLGGYDVCGVDKGECSLNIADRSSYHSVDIVNALSVSDVLKRERPDCLVNLAALSSVSDSWKSPQLAMQVNVIGSVNVLEACRCSVPDCRVMLIGSCEEYEPSNESLSEVSSIASNNPYGISKIAQEQMARLYAERYGLNVFITRSFNHTGPGQSVNFVLPSFCEQVARIQSSGQSGSIEVGNLDIVRDFSDVRDVVRAYRLILEKGRSGEVYNVGSESGYSLRELLDLITCFSSQDVAIRVDKSRFRPADTPRIVADCSKIRAELGWHPEIAIESSLREMYESFL